MSYKIYYNEKTKQNVKNIFWHDDQAEVKYILTDNFTAYRVDTGLAFEDEKEAQKKVDELNGEAEKVSFEKEGDSIKLYYCMNEIPTPQYKEFPNIDVTDEAGKKIINLTQARETGDEK